MVVYAPYGGLNDYLDPQSRPSSIRQGLKACLEVLPVATCKILKPKTQSKPGCGGAFAGLCKATYSL